MKSELHDAMRCFFFSCISKQTLSRIIPVCFLPSYLCGFSTEPKGGLLGFKSFTGQSALISYPTYFSFPTVITKFTQGAFSGSDSQRTNSKKVFLLPLAQQ